MRSGQLLVVGCNNTLLWHHRKSEIWNVPGRQQQLCAADQIFKLCCRTFDKSSANTAPRSTGAGWYYILCCMFSDHASPGLMLQTFCLYCYRYLYQSLLICIRMKERHVTHKLRFVHIIIILFHYPQSISLNSSNVMTVDLFVSNVLFVAIVS